MIAADLRALRAAAKTMGLQSNSDKCEFHRGQMPLADGETVLSSELPNIRERSEFNFELLGAAVFPQGLALLLDRLNARLATMHSRLPLLSSQAAFFLLQHSIGVQRITYFMRSSPAFLEPAHLGRLDATLSGCAEFCLNVALDDSSRTQLQLPVSAGGLGLRAPSDLALPCFLASVSGCSETVHRLIDPSVPIAFHESAWAS